MKIAGMVVWMLTASIGIYVLVVAGASRAAVGTRPAAEPDTGPAQAGSSPAPLAPEPDGATAVGTAALASIVDPESGTATAEGPGVGGSPMLEFSHPLLAILGLAIWIFFVMTGFRPFAWIAFGVVVATVLAGLSWVAITRRAGRRTAQPADREPAARPSFPARLVMLHGLAAACTVALVVISAVTAAHG